MKIKALVDFRGLYGMTKDQEREVPERTAMELIEAGLAVKVADVKIEPTPGQKRHKAVKILGPREE